MPFNSSSQFRTCLNRAMKDLAHGKDIAWDCEKFACKDPPVDYCHLLKNPSTLQEGPRGGIYFLLYGKDGKEHRISVPPKYREAMIRHFGINQKKVHFPKGKSTSPKRSSAPTRGTKRGSGLQKASKTTRSKRTPSPKTRRNQDVPRPLTVGEKDDLEYFEEKERRRLFDEREWKEGPRGGIYWVDSNDQKHYLKEKGHEMFLEKQERTSVAPPKRASAPTRRKKRTSSSTTKKAPKNSVRNITGSTSDEKRTYRLREGPRGGMYWVDRKGKKHYVQKS